MGSVEYAKQLKQMRNELDEYCKEHTTAEGKYDMDKDEFQRRSSAIIGVQKDYETSLSVEQNAAELKELSKPSNSVSFGGNTETKTINTKTLGQRFVEITKGDKDYRGVMNFTDVNVKTLMSTSAGLAAEVLRIPGLVVPYPSQTPRVADLIPKYETTMEALKFPEQTTRTNAAAETNEADPYPEATSVYTERSFPVQKISVFFQVTDEQLADVTYMEDVINQDLLLMLRQRLDTQIVVGNGSAPNLRGLSATSGIQTFASGGVIFDDVANAIKLVQNTGFAVPDSVLMNPTDYWNMVKVRTLNDGYVLGNPGDPAVGYVWGLPVTVSNDVVAGTAYVCDLRNYTMLGYKQGSSEIKVSDSHADNFSHGIVAIRASFRVALGIKRAKAIVKITGIA